MTDCSAAPTLADIEGAAGRLAGVAVETPLLSSPVLDARLGGRLLVKAECLQRTGSFKFRGAYNRLSLIPAERRAAGVVAFSSGNHAQGVAAAAQILGMPAVIVMPLDAPAIKVANTRGYGAEVVLYDRVKEDRQAIGARLSAERGATLVPPYDDGGVMAGQGTVGLEIAAQAKARGLSPDAVLVNCSGGGLVSGVATALAAKLPKAKVHTVEPAGFDDARRSLAAGHKIPNAELQGSICDALMANVPGNITFPVMQSLLGEGYAVTDDEVRAAMIEAFKHFKLVIEPGGAASLAAILSGRCPIAGRTVVVVASGGNVDPVFYAETLKAA